jgi:L-ascorbate metabolism protein UlaG (beta-lactamase superfamily)
VIDVVVSSHNHTDHFDPETLVPLLSRNESAVLVLPEANRRIGGERLDQAAPRAAAGAWDMRLMGLDAGATIVVAGIEITGIAAAHNTIERDEAGHCRFLGSVVRWGDWSIYHSGDTLLHDGLVPALRPLRVDLALLPINGNKPERRVAGNLDGREAAALAHDIGAQCVIPCHYDLFEFNTEPPDGFIAECRRIGQAFQVLRNGEGWGRTGMRPC